MAPCKCSPLWAQIIAVVTVYLLARVGGSVPTTTLLLAGIAISAAASAATAYLMYIRGDQLLVIYSWLLGGFNVGKLAGGASHHADGAPQYRCHGAAVAAS